jgi:hypothetical protein
MYETNKDKINKRVAAAATTKPYSLLDGDINQVFLNSYYEAETSFPWQW